MLLKIVKSQFFLKNDVLRDAKTITFVIGGFDVVGIVII